RNHRWPPALYEGALTVHRAETRRRSCPGKEIQAILRALRTCVAAFGVLNRIAGNCAPLCREWHFAIVREACHTRGATAGSVRRTGTSHSLRTVRRGPRR